MSNEDQKWARRGVALLLITNLISGSVGYSLHHDSPPAPLTPIVESTPNAGSPHVGKHDPHIELNELLAKEKLSPNPEAVPPSNCGVIDPPGDFRSALVGPFRDDSMKAIVFIENSNSQKASPRVVKCASPSATWDLEREFAPQYWFAKKH